MNLLAKNLTYLLKKHHTNPTSLAKLIPVSQPTISRIKKGEIKKPQLDNLISLAEFFAVTPKDLIETDMEAAEQHSPAATLAEPPASYSTPPNQINIAAMPLLDIEQALEYVEKPYLIKLGNCEKVATLMKHSERAFAVRMFDNSMRSTAEIEESFNKNDILIAEPQIKPRHEDIVVVNLNPQRKIGMVAKLEIDPFGNRRLRRTGTNIAGENPMAMPDGAYICGVVIEIKRRILTPETVDTRMNKNYNPLESIEKQEITD